MRMIQRKVLIGGRFLALLHKDTNQSGAIGVRISGIFEDIFVLRSPKQILLVKMKKMMSVNESIALLLKT